MRPRPRWREPRRTALAILATALLLGAPSSLRAQAGDSAAVWVLLTGELAAPADAPPALGAAALERRARQGIQLRDGDRPIGPVAIRTLEGAGLRVRHVSRWLRAVSGMATPAAVARLRALPGVADVRPVATLGAPPSPVVAPAAAPPDSFYGPSLSQVQALRVPLAQDFGLDGAGVAIALLDTGFRDDHEALLGRTVIAARDFIQGDTVVRNQPGDAASQADHGTRVWSVLAGLAPGELVGPAHGARFLLAKVDDVPTEPPADEDRWVAALEWADSMGARLVNSSLGYRTFDDGSGYPSGALNGDSALATRAADEAARRGILVVTAVGNQGPAAGTLVVPSDADSVIAVGAVTGALTPAGFSSRGPTADGRVKPDLVAPGVGVVTAQPGTFAGYGTASGTSFATPLVAGAAALVMQAWPQLTGDAVRQALILSATHPSPQQGIGYGVPDALAAVVFPGGLVAQPGPGVAPGEVLSRLDAGFAWSAPLVLPAARPISYVVQVAAQPAFASPIAADTVEEATSLTLGRPLPSGEGLWWRVVALTAAGDTIPGRAVGPFAMAPWVRLLTLADATGSFTADPTPTLRWAPLPAPPPAGPLTFDVEVLTGDRGQVVRRITGLVDTVTAVPQPLDYNVSYLWRVIARSPTGVADTVESAAAFVVTSVGAPPVTLLYQNFPNPFPRPATPHTRIWFDLARRSEVRLEVFDVRGRMLRRLIPSQPGCGTVVLDPGAYGRVQGGDPPCVLTMWDARTGSGEEVPAGVYVIRLVTDHGSHTVRTLYRP